MTDNKSLIGAENREILKTAKSETRKLSEQEQKTFDNNVSSISKLVEDIKTAEKELRTQGNPVVIPNIEKEKNMKKEIIDSLKLNQTGGLKTAVSSLWTEYIPRPADMPLLLKSSLRLCVNKIQEYGI